MPSSMVSSDDVVLGLVTAVQTACIECLGTSRSVWRSLGSLSLGLSLAFRPSQSREGIKIAHSAPWAYEEDRALFPDCQGKFLGGIYELHTVNDASDVDRLLTALAGLAGG